MTDELIVFVCNAFMVSCHHTKANKVSFLFFVFFLISIFLQNSHIKRIFFIKKTLRTLQAYTRLSDSAKRKAFDLERWKYFCLECNTIPYTARNSSASKPKGRNHTSQSRSHKILRGLKDIRERFREEARVIQNCLKTTATSRKESPLFNPSNHLFPSNQKTQKESPVFNPSDYSFQGGYPHLRTRLCRKPENHWYLQTGNVMNCEKGSWRYDTPIFEVRSEAAMFRRKSACVRS